MATAGLFIWAENNGLLAYTADVISKDKYDSYAGMFLKQKPTNWDLPETLLGGDRGELLEEAFIPLGDLEATQIGNAPLLHNRIAITRTKENDIQRVLGLSIQENKHLSCVWVAPKLLPFGLIDSLSHPGDFIWDPNNTDKTLLVRIF